MGIRGELYTTQVTLENRSYFFNVKENRNGDVFLQIVESKIKDGEDDRRAIVVFAEDMQRFLGGMDDSLAFIQKEHRQRAKLRAERKAAKDARYARGEDGFVEQPKLLYRRKGESRLVAMRHEEARRAEAERERMAGKLAEEERIGAGLKRTGRVVHVTSRRDAAPPEA